MWKASGQFFIVFADILSLDHYENHIDRHVMYGTTLILVSTQIEETSIMRLDTIYKNLTFDFAYSFVRTL